MHAVIAEELQKIIAAALEKDAEYWQRDAPVFTDRQEDECRAKASICRAWAERVRQGDYDGGYEPEKQGEEAAWTETTPTQAGQKPS